MSAARAQTVLPLDPPTRRRRQSSHEPNSNKRWEPKDDAKLVKMIRLPGWNIIAVARDLGRPKKGIYNWGDGAERESPRFLAGERAEFVPFTFTPQPRS